MEQDDGTKTSVRDYDRCMIRRATWQVAALAVLAGGITVPAQAGPAARDPQPMDRGVIVESVACLSDPTQTYSLYLPSAYAADKSWPALLVFDPRGRGTVAAEVFRAAAEELGWIVLSSNDTRSDGPVEPNVGAVRALWAEVHSRYRADPRRIHAAGFSGTVGVAWALGAEHQQLAGVIGAGGRLTPEMNGWPIAFAFFGSAGRHDFNYLETKDIAAAVARRGLPSRLAFFAGAHEWLPPNLARSALMWFDTLAMKDGRVGRDEQRLANSLREDERAAEALEREGRMVEALSFWRAASATFEGVLDSSIARARATALAARPDTRMALEDEQRCDEWERSTITQLMAEVRKLDDPEGFVVARQAANALRVPQLKAQAGKVGYRADAARRVLGSLFGQTTFYGWRTLMDRGAYRRAAFLQDVAAEIDPSPPAVWYRQALSYARAGDHRRAIQALGRAADRGLDDPALLTNEAAFAPLRSDPAFSGLVQRIIARRTPD